MAEIEVKYTVDPAGYVLDQSTIDGAQVDVTFTVNSTQNADGSYTVTNAVGTYQTTKSANGGTTVQVDNTESIVGVGQNGGGNGSNDNELFVLNSSQNPSSNPIVTGGGIDFDLSNGNNIDFYDINGSVAGTAPTDVPNYKQTNTSNNNSAHDVTEAGVTCFVSGGLIRTMHGEIAVENLAVGDVIVTASGANRPIRWLGHRTVDCRNHARPLDVTPVRIAAHAFGDNRPSRDLFVSPGHAICVDMLGEVLIPAAALVNGSTIQQVEVDEVTYWHVELDSHDILLAENLPAESYLDMGNRGFFKEADVVDLAAGPDAAASRTHADFCRPFHTDGSLVAFVRERLAARAAALGWRLSDAKPWAGVHVLADGVRVEPDVRGLAARFAIPAATRDVWLVSPAASPHEIGMSADARRLGLHIAELRVGADWDTRSVALDDPLLCAGFHVAEGAADALHRWTAGRARLPAALWADARSAEDLTLILRLCSGSAALPRWVGAEAGAGERDDVLAAA